MGKITMLAAGAAGYVLGARAGRERYDQIVAQARSVWGDPRVQERKAQAAAAAKETAADLGQQAASVAKDTATSAKGKAAEVKDTVQEKASRGDDAPGDQTTATFPADPGTPGQPARHV